MDYLRTLSNAAILQAIGERLERLRIESHLPDAEVLRRGGIKKDSWYNLKSGSNVTMVNLIKALRGLDRLDLLDPLVKADDGPSPMEAVRNAESRPVRRIRRTKPDQPPFEWSDRE